MKRPKWLQDMIEIWSLPFLVVISVVFVGFFALFLTSAILEANAAAGF